MSYTKTVLLSASLLFFTACAPNRVPVSEGGYYHSGIYFGTNLSPNYQKGIKNGCTTAKGNYKKSHFLFKNNNDYHQGWFLGRNKCRSLLVVEKDEQ